MRNRFIRQFIIFCIIFSIIVLQLAFSVFDLAAAREKIKKTTDLRINYAQEIRDYLINRHYDFRPLRNGFRAG